MRQRRSESTLCRDADRLLKTCCPEMLNLSSLNIRGKQTLRLNIRLFSVLYYNLGFNGSFHIWLQCLDSMNKYLLCLGPAFTLIQEIL